MTKNPHLESEIRSWFVTEPVAETPVPEHDGVIVEQARKLVTFVPLHVEFPEEVL